MKFHLCYIVKDRTDLGKNGSLTTCSPKKGDLSDSGGQLNHKYTADMWRSWSTQRACPEGTEFEGIRFPESNHVYSL